MRREEGRTSGRTFIKDFSAERERKTKMAGAGVRTTRKRESGAEILGEHAEPTRPALANVDKAVEMKIGAISIANFPFAEGSTRGERSNRIGETEGLY